MKKGILALIIISGFVIYAIGVTFWLQADKEVSFLCEYFEPGTELTKVESIRIKN